MQLKIVLKEETPSRTSDRQSLNFVQRDTCSVCVAKNSWLSIQADYIFSTLESWLPVRVQTRFSSDLLKSTDLGDGPWTPDLILCKKVDFPGDSYPLDDAIEPMQ